VERRNQRSSKGSFGPEWAGSTTANVPLNRQHGRPGAGLLWITGIFSVAFFPEHVWLVIGGGVRKMQQRRPKHVRPVEQSMGVILNSGSIFILGIF
jgi:hypothetical protein